jgi:ATP-dependent protease ClpP protease subunit
MKTHRAEAAHAFMTVSSGGGDGGGHLLTQQHADRAVIRLFGEVTMDTALRLTDEIELCRAYYKYDTIDLHLASPGGCSDATLFLLESIRAWQRGGLTIGTLGLTTVASAAALLLGAGTVGHRRARRSARILVHRARVIAPQHSVLTRDRLQAHCLLLEDADQKAFQLLARHVVEGRAAQKSAPPLQVPDGVEVDGSAMAQVHVRDEEHLTQLYLALADLDRTMAPEHALAYHLIDRIACDAEAR